MCRFLFAALPCGAWGLLSGTPQRVVVSTKRGPQFDMKEQDPIRAATPRVLATTVSYFSDGVVVAALTARLRCSTVQKARW
jgi:hypothetical protein